MMNRRLLIGHILFWVLIASIQIYTLIWVKASNGIGHWLTAYLLYIISFYINLLVIFPRWVKRRKVMELLMGWAALILLDTVVIIGVNKLFGFYQKGDLAFKFLRFFFQSCTILGIMIPLGIAYRFAVDWFNNDRIKRQLENQQLKTELAFLKSQMNPHFFFNTLNTIYILAYQQSSKTADAVFRLSEMMQYMLYESNSERVVVQKEVDYIRQLLALQELRMKTPIACSFTITGDLTRYTISPLLLIPFVENVFKHGVIDDPADPAELTLILSDKALHFYSRNRINNALKDASGGIGLVNAKRRMELLYADMHTLEILQDDAYYTVKLNVTYN